MSRLVNFLLFSELGVILMRRISFTTSRDPARKTRSFIHDIIKVVPSSSRFTRGSNRLSYSLGMMKSQGYSTAVIINSVKGNPNFLRIFNLVDSLQEFPYAIKIRGSTLSREYGKQSEGRSPKFSLLISSLNNAEEETIISRLFNTTTADISKLDKHDYVTVYADYLDKEEGLIFVEFLDKDNQQTGPRIKLRIVPRRIENGL
ncbi:hypothetical protein ES705_21537 [subsurface metagenome]